MNWECDSVAAQLRVIVDRAWRLLLGSLFIVSAASADSLSDALEGLRRDEKVSLDVRARFERNEIGGSEIEGYSLRTRLGYATGAYQGWRAMVEMEDLRFNNPEDRPALDVPTTELNQAWVAYEDYKLGRQVYALDDHRFVGHVGWRQNIQTFDALTASLRPSNELRMDLGYLDAVHRVNDTSEDLVGVVASGGYAISPRFTLSGFLYLLDFEQPTLASSDTFGIRGVGQVPTELAEWSYAFSFARQRDNGGSATRFNLDYIAAEIGARRGIVSAALGFEVLEGDGTSGFTTPLATVHKFNGFADAFAANSLGMAGGLPQGLEDYYAMFGLRLGEVPVQLHYHRFEAENVSDYLGEELDLVATYKLNDYTTLVAKFAKYRADGPEQASYGGLDREVLTVEANLAF